MYTKEDVIKESLKYFNNDELAANVFLKYCLKNKQNNYYELTPEDMHKRLSTEFARIEDKFGGNNKLSKRIIHKWLKNFDYIVPQGSPMFGIGNNFVNTSLSNCTVIDYPYDSISGIINTAKDMANLYKARCGVGIDISSLRPEGMKVNNSAGVTTGAWFFADFFSYVTRMIGQGERRGALMISMDIRHPDIFKFITMKKDLKKVTGANISVKITNDFMNSVIKNEDFELRFPINSNKILYKKIVKAKELWDLIILSATNTAEPGLLMWDNICDNLPANEYETFKSVTVNPCSELILSKYDSCRLISVNLKNFVNEPFTDKAKFNFDKLEEVMYITTRLSDDLVELEIEKIENIINNSDEEDVRDLWLKMKNTAINGRRCGIGTHGLADCLASMKYIYGEEESLVLVEKIYETIRNKVYSISVELSQERGCFPIFDWNIEKDNSFIKRLPQYIQDNIRKYGRRNISLLTNAPTGSVSILSQTSSGIEPVFRNFYIRRRKINNLGMNEKVSFIDQSGDRWEEYIVNHHNLEQWLKLNSKSDKKENEYEHQIPHFFITSDKINWENRIKLQGIIQKYIDHSISSTINLPKGTKEEIVSNLYMKAWENGLKGITVYVDGSRDGVLLDKKEEYIKENICPKRTKELICDIHQTNVKNNPWVIFVGLMRDMKGDMAPYEIFAGESNKIRIPKKYNKGIITKKPRKTERSIYDLKTGEGEEELLISDIVETFDDDVNAAFTRMISLSLRHGVPVRFVVEQLQKDKDSDMFCFSKAIARILKKYIKDGQKPSSDKICSSCGKETLTYQDGCVLCLDCGWTKCS